MFAWVSWCAPNGAGYVWVRLGIEFVLEACTHLWIVTGNGGLHPREHEVRLSSIPIYFLFENVCQNIRLCFGTWLRADLKLAFSLRTAIVAERNLKKRERKGGYMTFTCFLTGDAV